MTIGTGHGGLKRNKIPAKKVKPKGKGKTGWVEAATAVSKAAKASKGGSEEAGASPMDSDAQAWKQIGDAGESIALERKRRRDAKATDSAAVKANVA
jgi:hypothetical protein